MGFHCTLPQLIGLPVQSIVEELLRKFKTGNRWQKLWVVFTNFPFVFLQDARGLYSCSSLMQRVLDFQPLRAILFFLQLFTVLFSQQN